MASPIVAGAAQATLPDWVAIVADLVRDWPKETEKQSNTERRKENLFISLV